MSLSFVTKRFATSSSNSIRSRSSSSAGFSSFISNGGFRSISNNNNNNSKIKTMRMMIGGSINDHDDAATTSTATTTNTFGRNNNSFLGISSSFNTSTCTSSTSSGSSIRLFSTSTTTSTDNKPAAATTTKVPTLEDAKLMPVKYSEMNNELVIALAESGGGGGGGTNNPDATIEMLKRHIMAIDNVDYETACITFNTIELKSKGSLEILLYPYLVGIGVGMIAAIGSIPMVFDLNTAEWFNEYYVTTDVPEPADLETWLEVGSWTWNWMEPPLGTISFALLCLQYARAQMSNLGLRPYTSKVKEFRAKRLVQEFPQYDSRLLKMYSESSPLITIMMN